MKLLTGKCKKDFTKWYDGYITKDKDKFISGTDINYFNLLLPSMQWGVIQDFADSKGIDLDVRIGIDIKTDIRDGFDYVSFNYMGWCETRDEAREQAIIKFNEIYNEKY